MERKILLVEDDSDDAEFLRRSLAQHNSSAHITRTSQISDAVAALEDSRFDVVLLDLNLPDGRGIECVEKIQKADELVPIVVLSGHADEDFAVEILNRGVQDYLVKWEGDGRIILRSIRYAIERKRAEIKVNYLARLDWPTCLPNRQYLRDELAHATTRAVRNRRTMALMVLYLDGFKTVNETLGRSVGDALLREVVQRLTACNREGDLLARLGSDEFAFLLKDVEGPLEVEAVVGNILGAFQKGFQIDGQQVPATVCVGITMCPTDSSDPVALLNNAVVAMREAKEQGPNTFKFFAPGTHEQILSHRQYEADLKGAIEQQQFELLYQPQHRLADHRIEAVEALLRWKHPERGHLGPSEFISVAEKSGQIVPLGRWVIEEACCQLGRWEAAGVPMPRVAINIAAAELRQADFPEMVRSVLQSHSIDPGLIELEFSERSLMDDTVDARKCLHALKDIGVRLAVDDFGTGRSHLSYLRQLPVDVLKIDRSFVSELDASEDAQAICSAILSIAHRFLLDAVALGIETHEQEAFLTKYDCLYGQGNYLSAPTEADALSAMLVERGGQATRRPRVMRKRAAMKTG
jgi:diguanylate cyclase (GGDEF)-like protein